MASTSLLHSETSTSNEIHLDSSLSTTQVSKLSSFHSFLPTLECVPQTIQEFLKCACFLDLLYDSTASESILNTSLDFKQLKKESTYARFLNTKPLDSATHHPNVLTPKSHLVYYVNFIHKYQTYLDLLLLEADFFVFYSKWNTSMSLVKLLLFLLVLNEFNPYGFCSHFGIIFVPSNGNEQEHKWEGIHALIYDLACTSTHFHAAWARIRIHKKVYGPSFLHRVHQFVTWDTELSQPPLQLQVRHLDMALMYLTLHVPQTDIQRSMTYPHKGVIQMARVHLKSVVDSSFFRETRQLVFKDTPTQLLLNLVNDIQKKEPITLSLLESKACQDVRFLYYKDVLPNCRVIACGETSLQLDFLVSEYFRVPFSSIDVDMDVQLIVLEPENSLSAVHDPLTYLLQENQLPSTQPDFASLMKNQKLALLHAMQFPKVKYILYVVRSFHSNETTEVIHACCEIHSNFEWVPLPSSLSICTDSATFQHGLFVFHPELAPNGMFIALLQRVASPSSSKASSNINLDTQPSNICSEGDEVQVEEEEEEEQEEEESEEINKVNPIINSNTKPSKKKRKNKRKTKSLTYLHVTKSHDTLEVYGQGYYLKEQRKNSGPTKPVYTSLPHLKPWK